MKFLTVIFVFVPMVRVAVQLMGKYAIDVVGKTTLKKNADKIGLVDTRVSIPDLTRNIQNVHIDAMYMKLMRIVMRTMA